MQNGDWNMKINGENQTNFPKPKYLGQTNKKYNKQIMKEKMIKFINRAMF